LISGAVTASRSAAGTVPGKSGIIRLICGEKITYTGAFLKSGSLRISYVSQDTSPLSGDLSDYAV